MAKLTHIGRALLIAACCLIVQGANAFLDDLRRGALGSVVEPEPEDAEPPANPDPPAAEPASVFDVTPLEEEMAAVATQRAKAEVAAREAPEPIEAFEPAAAQAHADDYVLQEAEELLRIFQELDPPGVAARDLRECLLLQLRDQKCEQSLTYLLVRDAFDDLIAHRWSDLAKRYGLEPKAVQDAADLLADRHPIQP